MAKFLDSKERVLDLRLTSYGKYLLSVGKFRPHSYAFFDDNVIYDGEYAGANEPQNAIHGRIKKETPYLESMVLFEEVEKQSDIKEDPGLAAITSLDPDRAGGTRVRLAQEWFGEMTEYAQSFMVAGMSPPATEGVLDLSGFDGGGLVGLDELAEDDPARIDAEARGADFAYVGPSLSEVKEVPVARFFKGDVFPTEYLPRKDIFKIDQAIGDASQSAQESNLAPAWKVIVLNGKIKNFDPIKARMSIVLSPVTISGLPGPPSTSQRFTLTDIDGNTQEFEFTNSTTYTYEGKDGSGRIRISKRNLDTTQTLADRIGNAIAGASNDGFIRINFKGTRIVGSVLGLGSDPIDHFIAIDLEQYRGGKRGNIDHSATLAGITGFLGPDTSPAFTGFPHKFAGGAEGGLDVTRKDVTFPSGSNNIPQINIEVDYEKNVYSAENLSMQFSGPNETRNRTGLFLDDKYVQLDTQHPMVYVDEVNTEIMNKNFDVEVFLVTGSSDNIGYNKDGLWGHIEPTYQLVRKYFAEPKDQIIDGKMMTNHPYDYDAPSVDTTSVEYYFNLAKDSETNRELACKQIQDYNKSSYYIDLDLDCSFDEQEKFYNDIYGSEVEPEICLD
tara:strand:+ start:262 stop:2100 length:1839 start_codon:yes stop_codon:yes gene_type:complete